MKKLILTLVIISIITTSCTKEGAPGPQGTQGNTGATGQTGNQGPNAKTYDYNLTFSSTTTTAIYGGIPVIGASDIILTYIRVYSPGGTMLSWSSTPYINNGIQYMSGNDGTGNVWVKCQYTNGSTVSPYTTATQVGFKSVVIKGDAGLRKASINYSNYGEVAAYYGLNNEQ